MNIEQKIKRFCREENFPLVDEMLTVLDTKEVKDITTIRNTERLRILISKFKYNKDLLDKDITVIYGEVGLKEIFILSDFAILSLTATRKVFNKIEKYNQLIVFESEV